VAFVDREGQPVVIQVVYDGPPEAGKTTSVRALARSFGREAYTPEEENGRTVYFDWLEHTGGRFEGAPIHCQIASVPGQDRWLERRLYFLERADVVVFVGDTTRAGWPGTVERLGDLRRRLDARDGPPIGVVFQANRRDAEDALPISVVREVTSDRIALVESVALDGTGVREAFVFAVRLALDRVREARRGGANPGNVLESEATLDFLRGLEDGAATPVSLDAPAAGEAPWTPSHDVASGLVWPPVEGRILLREAAHERVRARNTPQGDWSVDLPNGWHCHSSAGACFTEFDRGRAALVEWARLHSSAQSLTSKRRCVVLAETGDGSYRLWQVLRHEPSLRALFFDDFESLDPASAARLLTVAGRLLTEARDICTALSLPLPCTLDTIGVSEFDGPVFVGLVPLAPRLEEGPVNPESIASELAALVSHRPAHERAHMREAVRYNHTSTVGSTSGSRVIELLTQLLVS
jgi:signal recognition particle receptor subunit beta